MKGRCKMSNLSTHIRKEKPRLMNKEDKEYWRKKVADKLSSKRSDLEAVFESDIQKMKDKKWKSFLKSLNLENKLSTYAFYMKDYWKFKDEKDKIERDKKQKMYNAYERIKDKILHFRKMRQWEDSYSDSSNSDDDRDKTSKIMKYLDDVCYSECKKQFQLTKKAKSLVDLDNTEDLLIDALHISNSDPAILGLIKYHLQKVGVSNLGILDVNMDKFKQLTK